MKYRPINPTGRNSNEVISEGTISGKDYFDLMLLGLERPEIFGHFNSKESVMMKTLAISILV